MWNLIKVCVFTKKCLSYYLLGFDFWNFSFSLRNSLFFWEQYTNYDLVCPPKYSQLWILYKASLEQSDECLVAAFKGTPAAMPKFCALVPLNGSLIICLLRTGKILPPKAALKKARNSESFIFRGNDIFRRIEIFRRIDNFRRLDVFPKLSFLLIKSFCFSKDRTYLW